MTKNTPTFSIPKPCKIYPNWAFWFENKPSGNPAAADFVENATHYIKTYFVERSSYRENF
jgi:hypothetical protein